MQKELPCHSAHSFELDQGSDVVLNIALGAPIQLRSSSLWLCTSFLVSFKTRTVSLLVSSTSTKASMRAARNILAVYLLAFPRHIEASRENCIEQEDKAFSNYSFRTYNDIGSLTFEWYPAGGGGGGSPQQFLQIPL